ncbi:MAG: DUF2007 domain-containing protein [Prevotellaceae bacterium]|jgi:hypothetical protein|nr:DUF2007 domain-containing protein [Prevotellaceae bacterium]
MEGKTIIIATYPNITEAMYAKDALEQNGLSTFISNENTAHLYPMFSSSVSGIRLHVFEADKARAEAILSEISHAKPE